MCSDQCAGTRAPTGKNIALINAVPVNRLFMESICGFLIEYYRLMSLLNEGRGVWQVLQFVSVTYTKKGAMVPCDVLCFFIVMLILRHICKKLNM